MRKGLLVAGLLLALIASPVAADQAAVDALRDAGFRLSADAEAELLAAEPGEVGALLSQVVSQAVADDPAGAVDTVLRAIGAFPDQAASIVTASATAAPEQVVVITQAAVEASPSLAAEITSASAAVAPERVVEIVQAAVTASPELAAEVTRAASAVVPEATEAITSAASEAAVEAEFEPAGEAPDDEDPLDENPSES